MRVSLRCFSMPFIYFPAGCAYIYLMLAMRALRALESVYFPCIFLRLLFFGVKVSIHVFPPACILVSIKCLLPVMWDFSNSAGICALALCLFAHVFFFSQRCACISMFFLEWMHAHRFVFQTACALCVRFPSMCECMYMHTRVCLFLLCRDAYFFF